MAMHSHEVDYEIVGHDTQMLIVELDPGETVIAEAGAMTFMEQGIAFETRMGDGSEPEQGLLGKLFDAGKRMMTGTSMFMTHFSNRGAGKQHVAFSAAYPGTVIAVDLAQVPGGELICQKDAFLAAALGTKIDVSFTKRFGTGLFGGEGFVLTSLRGDGRVFVHAGGTVVERQLHNETLRVDTGCLVAFEPGIDYDIQRAGNLKSMVFGGEGLFLATLHGSGRVWLQSLPFSRFADRILANAPAAGGNQTGEGSVLGGIGRMLDGN